MILSFFRRVNCLTALMKADKGAPASRYREPIAKKRGPYLSTILSCFFLSSSFLMDTIFLWILFFIFDKNNCLNRMPCSH